MLGTHPDPSRQDTGECVLGDALYLEPLLALSAMHKTPETVGTN